MVPGPLMIEASGQRYVVHAGETYQLTCDGKEHPAPHSGMLRCYPPGQELAFKRTEDGKVDRRYTFATHSGGLKLTEKVTAYFAGVAPSTERNEYRRASGTAHSFVGKWAGVSSTEVGGDAIDLRVHEGFLYFRDERDGNITDARLDGTPSSFLSPGVPTGIAWTNVLEADRRIVGHPLRDGKPYGTELMELSSDGRSIKISQADGSGSYETFEKR